MYVICMYVCSMYACRYIGMYVFVYAFLPFIAYYLYAKQTSCRLEPL